MTRGRIAGTVVVLGGIVFGFFGGEYGTLDWWTLRRDLTRERAAIGRLDTELDSLERVARALETDSATQERVARERFGMLRPGELLFKVEAGSEP